MIPRRRPAGKAVGLEPREEPESVPESAPGRRANAAQAETTSRVHSQTWMGRRGRAEEHAVTSHEDQRAAPPSVQSGADPLVQRAALVAVAHDLKEPLRSISTLAEIAMEDLEQHNEIRTKDDLARIRAATSRMGALIDFVLRRPEAAGDPGTVDLSEVLEEVAESLGQPMDRDDSRVRTEGNLGSIIGHRRTLHSLFANLISNGLRHNRDAGARVVVRRANRRYASEIIIEDNGPGFHGNPYEAAGRGPRRDRQRTHGAEIVGQAVAQLGGKLWIERRNPPPGMVVHVLLPPS
jgi:signal transduction histidine kinase